MCIKRQSIYPYIVFNKIICFVFLIIPISTYQPILYILFGGFLSLIHISEPTRRTPIYSSAASDVYKETVHLSIYCFQQNNLFCLPHYSNKHLPTNTVYPLWGLPVSYTHLRAHETDTYLFVGSVRCV